MKISSSATGFPVMSKQLWCLRLSKYSYSYQKWAASAQNNQYELKESTMPILKKSVKGKRIFVSIPDSGTDFWKLFFRGFSSISLIEDKRSRKRYALKKITCHSTEDQIQAKKEIDFHKKFDHPNILNLIGSEIKGQADIVHDVTSDAYLVLPYFPVSFVIVLRPARSIVSCCERENNAGQHSFSERNTRRWIVQKGKDTKSFFRAYSLNFILANLRSNPAFTWIWRPRRTFCPQRYQAT